LDNTEAAPGTQHGYAPQKKAGHHALLPPFFSVIVFAADTLAAHLFFLERQKKNKRAAPTTRSKKQCHKKSGVSYLNIMWPYRFASHFFCLAYLHANAAKKNPISTLC
jgi:hypothetical protein